MSILVDKKDICPVCEDKEKLDTFAILQCGHSICIVCLYKWIKSRKYNCVMCRQRFEYSFMMIVKNKFKIETVK